MLQGRCLVSNIWKISITAVGLNVPPCKICGVVDHMIVECQVGMSSNGQCSNGDEFKNQNQSMNEALKQLTSKVDSIISRL